MAVEVGQVWQTEISQPVRITGVGEELLFYKLCKNAAQEMVFPIDTFLLYYRPIGHWDAARGVVVRDEVQHG